ANLAEEVVAEQVARAPGLDVEVVGRDRGGPRVEAIGTRMEVTVVVLLGVAPEQRAAGGEHEQGDQGGEAAGHERGDAACASAAAGGGGGTGVGHRGSGVRGSVRVATRLVAAGGPRAPVCMRRAVRV